MPKRRRRRAGEGAIFPKANDPRGRWVAQVGYRGEDGRRKFLTRIVRSENAAKLVMPTLLAAAGVESGLTDVRQTLDTFLADWLVRVTPSIRPQTLRSYKGHVDHHIGPLLGGIHVDALRVTDVDRLVRSRQKAGSSPATIARILTTLSMALSAAVDEGTLARNVARVAHHPKVVRRPITAMTPDGARAILGAVEGDPLAPLYGLLLGSGMRSGEAIGLDWRDVDLERGTVFIRQGKTVRSVRTIPIPPFVVAALKAHRARAGTIDPKAPIFTGTRKGERLRTDVAAHRFAELLAAAKIPHLRVHDLRHAHATLLLAAGTPMQMIADQLGHSNPATTASVYAHVQPGALRRAVDALGDYIRQG